MMMSQRSASIRGLSRRAARRAVRAQARAGNWLPGSAAPEWIPDNVPGNYGASIHVAWQLQQRPAALADGTAMHLASS